MTVRFVFSASFCLNGHNVTSSTKKFCDICGSLVLYACQSCGAPLIGLQRDDQTSEAKYCYQCGKAYPWQEMFEKLNNRLDFLKRKHLDNNQ